MRKRESVKQLREEASYLEKLYENSCQELINVKSELKDLKNFLAKNPSFWSLKEALNLIQELEIKLKDVGFHCGLTGGVLFLGKSEKDLDIIIYPHHKSEEDGGKYEDIIKILEKFNMVRLKTKDEVQKEDWYNQDTKHVEIWFYKNKRIDFFFMEQNNE